MPSMLICTPLQLGFKFIKCLYKCSKAVREDEDTEFGERGKKTNLALGSHVKSKNATSNEDA